MLKLTRYHFATQRSHLSESQCDQNWHEGIIYFCLPPTGRDRQGDLHLSICSGERDWRDGEFLCLLNGVQEQVDALSRQLLHCQPRNLRLSRWSRCSPRQSK